MQFADMNRHSKTPVALAALVLAVASLWGEPSIAQPVSSDKMPASKKITKPDPAKPDLAKPLPAKPVPAASEINTLIRTTLRKLNRNNETSNYEELHESMTPEMQLSVTPQKLSDAFSGFRRDGIDLSGVAQIEPQFLRQPSINEEGVLLLNGIFPTQPRLVLFNMGYRKVDGIWMLQAFQINAPTQEEWSAEQARQRQAKAAQNKSGSQEAPALDYSTSPPTALRW